MKKKGKRRIFSNPWFIGIGSSVIAFILIQITLSFFNVNLIKEIFKFFLNLITLVGKFFTLLVKLPVWAIILLILAIPIIILLIAFIAPKKKETGPTPKEYTKDTFDGIVWRWAWKYNRFAKRYYIEEFAPYCPGCDCQLNYRFGSFLCPNCGFEKSDISKSVDELKMLISHQVRKRYFPDQ